MISNKKDEFYNNIKLEKKIGSIIRFKRKMKKIFKDKHVDLHYLIIK